MKSPGWTQPAAQQPVAEDVEAEASHYQNGAPKLKWAERLAEDQPIPRPCRRSAPAARRARPSRPDSARAGAPTGRSRTRAGVGDDEDGEDELERGMGERGEAARPLDEQRQQEQRRRRAEARPARRRRAYRRVRRICRRCCPRPSTPPPRSPSGKGTRLAPSSRARADQRDAEKGDAAPTSLRRAAAARASAPRRERW